MKRDLLLAVMLLFAASLWSQTPLTDTGIIKDRIRLGKADVSNQTESELKHHKDALKRAAHFNSAAATTGTQKLDSLVGEINFGMWLPFVNESFTYDIHGRVTVIVNSEYDFGTMQLTPVERESMSYNAQSKLSEYLLESYGQTGPGWSPEYQEVYDYNAAGEISEIEIRWWDQTTSSWIVDSKSEYSYNASGYLQAVVYYYWMPPNQWEISFKEEYTRDAANRVTEMVVSWWDDIAQAYEPLAKDEYLYHVNGKVSEVKTYGYIINPVSWKPDYLIEYEYDAVGNNTLVSNSYYDTNNMMWIPGQKTYKTFDANNNNTTQVSIYWDEIISQWVLSDSTVNVHNNTWSYNDLILPFIFPDDEILELFSHMLTNLYYYTYDETTLQWESFYRLTLHYSQFTIGIAEQKGAEVKVFPNPATDHIRIETGSAAGTAHLAELYDLTGRRILDRQITENGVLDISNLSGGIYILKVSDGQRPLYTGKIVIK